MLGRALLFFACMLPPVLALAGMGEAEARHLLNRAGFGASWEEIARLAPLSREQAVDRLLANTAEPAAPQLQADIQPGKLKNATDQEKKALLRQIRQDVVTMQGWWLKQIITTPSPLQERMTLFWHNHFVSGMQKVKVPALMLQQNQMLRQHATGNFADLLQAVAHDPAMLVYLDNVSNQKDKPNENFARELMELFTLGEGHYSEQDVREAARAFTGWSIDRQTRQFRFYAFRHDNGSKTLLGQRGNLNGDDVIRILLAQPATAETIVRKLWREFISPTPDPAEVSRMAHRFRNQGYALKPLLRDMLTSPHFYDPSNRGSLIKSPVDLVAGTLHTLHINATDPVQLARITTQLGQSLFNPPNVKGWPGQNEWISSTSLLNRKQWLERLARGTADGGMMRLFAPAQPDFRPDQVINALPKPAEQSLRTLLLPLPPTDPVPASPAATKIAALLQDPVYQLK